MDPPFDKSRHQRYWQRCLRTLLPQQYTGNDSTRMTLGCFAIAAVDLLSADVPPILSPTDRARLRTWVLACQHPGGGFSGGPTHVLPGAAYDGFAFTAAAATTAAASADAEAAAGGPGAGLPAVGARGEANIAATLFALQLLAMLSDEGDEEERVQTATGDGGETEEGSGGAGAFVGVDQPATLQWLQELQRADGSFGEYVEDIVDRVAPSGRRRLVAGGSDMRYCYIAAMIRWMLRGDANDEPAACTWVRDIDVDALVRYIRQGQTYDGGFAESSTHESHAGYAFCAVAALSLLQRTTQADDNSVFSRGIVDLPALLRWLSLRCFLYQTTEDSADDNNNNNDDDAESWQESIVTDVTPDHLLQPDAHPLLGFNGRCNKHADTCYTWWTIGTMSILARHGIVPAAQDDAPSSPHSFGDGPSWWEASRRFLLEQTQHLIGGFAKTPGGPPDMYHAYLGLAVLAVQGENALKAFDPAVCVSTDTVEKIEAARAGLLRYAGRAAVERRSTLLQMAKASACQAVSSATAAANRTSNVAA